MCTHLRFATISVWLLFLAATLAGQTTAPVYQTGRNYLFVRLPDLPEGRVPCLWAVGPSRTVVFGGLAANGTTALYKWTGESWLRFGAGVGTFCKAAGLDPDENVATPKTSHLGFLSDGTLYVSGLTGDGKETDLWLIQPNGASSQIATGELVAPSLLYTGSPLTIIRRTSEVQEWRNGAWVNITQGSIFTTKFYRTADALFWTDIVDAVRFDLATKQFVRVTNPLPGGRNKPFEEDYNAIPNVSGGCYLLSSRFGIDKVFINLPLVNLVCGQTMTQVYSGGVSWYSGTLSVGAMLPRFLYRLESAEDFVLLGGSHTEDDRVFEDFNRPQDFLIRWSKAGGYSVFLGRSDNMWGVLLAGLSNTPPAGDPGFLAFAVSAQAGGPFRNGPMFPVLALLPNYSRVPDSVQRGGTIEVEGDLCQPDVRLGITVNGVDWHEQCYCSKRGFTGTMHCNVPTSGDAMTLEVIEQIGGPTTLPDTEPHFPVITIPYSALPRPTISAVVHGGSFLPVPLAPGTWFSVLGTNLGTKATASDANTFQLGGASITVCGFPAILNYNSGATQSAPDVLSWQINALMPNGVLGHESCSVVVTVNGQQAAPYSVTITDESLELFQFVAPASDGSAPPLVLPVITHADYSLVGPLAYSTQLLKLTPAKAGEIIILWGTGCKMTTNPVVSINGTPAQLLFAGITGLGLCQLNIVVPPDTPSGIASLTLPDPAPSYKLAVE